MPKRREQKHGAQVYFYDDGVILVKKTANSANSGRYVIDGHGHKERHIDPGDDRVLGEAVRLAGQGKL